MTQPTEMELQSNQNGTEVRIKPTTLAYLVSTVLIGIVSMFSIIVSCATVSSMQSNMEEILAVQTKQNQQYLRLVELQSESIQSGTEAMKTTARTMESISKIDYYLAAGDRFREAIELLEPALANMEPTKKPRLTINRGTTTSYSHAVEDAYYRGMGIGGPSTPIDPKQSVPIYVPTEVVADCN